MNWVREHLIPILVIGIMVSIVLLAKHYKQNEAEYHQYNAHNSAASALAAMEKPTSNQVTPEGSEQHSQEAIEKAVDRSLQRADNLAQVDMTLYALIGLIVGVLGIGLIGMTLLYTKDAAEAAAKTLKIARESLDDSRVHLRGRPHIVSATLDYWEMIPILRIQIKNIGETPIISASITANIQPQIDKNSMCITFFPNTPALGDNIIPLIEKDKTKEIVVHQQMITFTNDRVKNFDDLTFLFKVSFTDIFNKTHKGYLFRAKFQIEGVELKQNSQHHLQIY